MWIVKNTLKGTLSFRGLDVSIPAGRDFDLDTLGRDSAEESNQVKVAFEEGYLQSVYKAPRQQVDRDAPLAFSDHAETAFGISAEQFDDRLEGFKREFMAELKARVPVVSEASQLEDVRAAISKDMQELVGELKLVRDRFDTVKGRVLEDESLSEAEVKARIAFLEEQERELLKNFESLGRRVEQEDADGDVMGKADLLANL